MPKKVEVVEMPPSLAESEACENINKVPNRQWRKWNQQARFTFNSVFNDSGIHQVMKHPLSEPLPEQQWLTVRWNFAWIAAEAVHKSTKDASDAAIVMPLFRDCLMKLYSMAGVEPPKSFTPVQEARRLARALHKV